MTKEFFSSSVLVKLTFLQFDVVLFVNSLIEDFISDNKVLSIQLGGLSSTYLSKTKTASEMEHFLLGDPRIRQKSFLQAFLEKTDTQRLRESILSVYYKY